jgi:hypothetical protein
MIAKLVIAGYERCRRDVMKVRSDGLYMTLFCSEHPFVEHHYVGDGSRTSILLYVEGKASQTEIRESNDAIYMRAVKKWFER